MEEKSSQEHIKDITRIIAPAGIEISSSFLKIGDKFAKTFFVFSYPRYLSTGWFQPIIDLATIFDISIVINPVDTGTALHNLIKKNAPL